MGAGVIMCSWQLWRVSEPELELTHNVVSWFHEEAHAWRNASRELSQIPRCARLRIPPPQCRHVRPRHEKSMRVSQCSHRAPALPPTSPGWLLPFLDIYAVLRRAAAPNSRALWRSLTISARPIRGAQSWPRPLWSPPAPRCPFWGLAGAPSARSACSSRATQRLLDSIRGCSDDERRCTRSEGPCSVPPAHACARLSAAIFDVA